MHYLTNKAQTHVGIYGLNTLIKKYLKSFNFLKFNLDLKIAHEET